jgi:uncharacterized ion transporter superfamily protein YfcC
MRKYLKMPNTFVLLFSLLAMIALATWFVPGGKYETMEVAGKTVVNPDSFHYVQSNPQGFVALMTAPIKGFVEAALIIGFVLIVGGAFSVLQRTNAIDAMIKSVAKAHTRSAVVRALVIPVFVSLFSLGGATFGMAEEAIPFVLIFIPLALALGYDSIVGVAIPFVGSQVGFAAAFVNPFNVGVAQSIAGVPLFSGIGFRLMVWAVATVITIAFLMLYAARIKRTPQASPTYALDLEKRQELGAQNLANFAGMAWTHIAVLTLFAITLLVMVAGVVSYQWYIEEIAALFLVMAMLVGVVGRLNADEFVEAFMQGAKDLVTTALVIALARATVIVARDAQIIDTILHSLMPLVQSSSPTFAAQKMFVIQSVINFFIHSGTGQAALTMPIMAPLADLVGVTRQTAVLAFQFGEFTTPMIPTSGITVGVLALAKIPWLTWAKWMIPLQIMYFILSLFMLAIACRMGW